MLAKLDVDGSGMIEFSEFLKVHSSIAPLRRTASARLSRQAHMSHTSHAVRLRAATAPPHAQAHTHTRAWVRARLMRSPSCVYDSS